MQIILGGLQTKEVAFLLQQHQSDMLTLSPPESTHTLDLLELAASDVTFWSVWLNDELLGCGALKELSNTHGEIKSMRTSADHLRKGVAETLLTHIITEAIHRSYRRISLETGSARTFLPAQQLYKKFGFQVCQPFDKYIKDPHSDFMTKILH